MKRKYWAAILMIIVLFIILWYFGFLSSYTKTIAGTGYTNIIRGLKGAPCITNMVGGVGPYHWHKGICKSDRAVKI